MKKNDASGAGQPKVPIENDTNSSVIQLARGAGLNLVGKVGGRVFHLVGQVILARFLGPAVFGLYSIGWNILQFVGLSAPLGLDQGVIRIGSQYWGSDKNNLRIVVLQSMALAIISGGVWGAIFFVGASWLAELFKKPNLEIVIRLFAISFPLLSILRVSAAATRVTQKMKYSVLTEEIIHPVANISFVLLAIFFGWGLQGSVFASNSAYFVASGLAIYYCWRLFLEPGPHPPGSLLSGYRTLLAFSMPTALAGLVNGLLLWIDRLLIGFLRSASDAGIYQAVYQTTIVFAVILSAMNTIFVPMIADLYHKRETGQLEETYRVSTKWGLYLSLPFFFILILFPGTVMETIFGGDYISGAIPIVILASAQIINVGTGAVGFLLIMTGREKLWLGISVGVLLFNISLNVTLIPAYGIWGAALGTAISIGGLYIIELLSVRRILGLWPYDNRFLKGLIASIITIITLMFAEGALPTAGIERLILVSILSFFTFVLCLLILGPDQEDHDAIQIIVRSLANK